MLIERNLSGNLSRNRPIWAVADLKNTAGLKKNIVEKYKGKDKTWVGCLENTYEIWKMFNTDFKRRWRLKIKKF